MCPKLKIFVAFHVCVLGSLWAFFVAISLIHCAADGDCSNAPDSGAATSNTGVWLIVAAKILRRVKDGEVKDVEGNRIQLERKQPQHIAN